MLKMTPEQRTEFNTKASKAAAKKRTAKAKRKAKKCRLLLRFNLIQPSKEIRKIFVQSAAESSRSTRIKSSQPAGKS